MEKKMTKKEMFAMVQALVQSVECEEKEVMVGFLAHEVELLEKKATSKKETETQKQNAVLKGVITEVLSASATPLTISEMQAKSEVLGALSNQKVSAVVKQMVDITVKKTVEGKKSTFSLK